VSDLVVMPMLAGETLGIVAITRVSGWIVKRCASMAAAKRAELAKLSGAAFDKAYIDNEVAYHKTVNDAEHVDSFG
jgi:predicted outer membrane protein